MRVRIRRRAMLAGAAAALALMAYAAVPGTASAASSMLVRYPYLTIPTPTSVQVTWATTNTPTEAAAAGIVTWGPAGSSCTDSQATASTSTYAAAFTGTSTTYAQHTATIGGAAGTATALSPSTAYCYRIWTGTTAPQTDLVGTDTTAPMTFTTLPDTAATPFSFDVLGDWGETSLSSSTTATFNPYQQQLDAQIAASTQGSDPALFAVSTGDIAYNDGSQTNYGDMTAPHAADSLNT